MVENYAKDLKESIYHGTVVSALANRFNNDWKIKSLKVSLPFLGKFDFEDRAKLVAIIALSDFIKII